MNKKMNVERKILYDFAAIAISVVCMFQVAGWYQNQFQVVNDDKDALERELQLKSVFVNPDNQSLLLDLQESIPKGFDQTDVGTVISSWVRGFGLQLTGLSFRDFEIGPEDPIQTSLMDSNLEIMPPSRKKIELQIKGPQTGIQSLISQLELERRIFDIISLQISQDEETSDYLANLEVYIYYR